MIDQTQQTPSSPGTASGLQVTLRPARASRHVDTIVLRQGLYAVGAAVDSDVVLPVGGVQRQHCRIEISEQGASVTADSRMTWINDQPVDSRDLCDGDRLAIGPLEFAVEIRNLSSGEATGADARPLQDDEFQHLVATASRGEDGAVGDSASSEASADEVAAQLTRARQMLASHEARLAQTEQVIEELEQRRTQLQSVVDELIEDADRHRERHDRLEQEDRRRREQLARLENEACLWRAALAEREQDVDQLWGDLERRFTALQQVEAEIETQSRELDTAAEDLAVQRTDYSEREALLQARLDEVAHTEAACNEREADLRRRTDELEEQAGALARQSEELQQQLQELDQQRRDAEASAEAQTQEYQRYQCEQMQLSEQLRACEQELAELRTQLADQQTDQNDRELQLRERETELEELAAQLQSQFEELEQRETELQAVRDELDGSRQQLDAERQECQTQRDQIEADRLALETAREELEHHRQQLASHSEELQSRAAELQQRLSTIKTWRNELRQQAGDHPSCEKPDRQQQADQRETALVQSRQGNDSGYADVESVWAEIAESRAELDRQREEFSTEFESLARDRKRLREEQKEVDVLRRNLQERQRELEEERRLCREQLAHADAAEQRQEADVQAFESARDTWQCERQSLVEQVGALNEELEDLRSQLNATRTEAESAPERPVPAAAAVDHFTLETGDDASLVDEVVDLEESDAATDEELPEAVRELRAQMAAVFGFDAAAAHTAAAGPDREAAVDEADEVTFDETYDIVDEATVDETYDIVDEVTADEAYDLVDEATADETFDVANDESAVSAGLEAEDPASMTSDMQRLYALDQGSDDAAAGTAAADAQTEAEPGTAPVETFEAVEVVEADEADEADEMVEVVELGDTDTADPQDPVVEVAVQAAVFVDAEQARQQAREAAELERQKLNSLREVANLSARSALARHASTELKSALLAEGLVTGLCVTGTIVLLASPLWSESSLVHWGILFAVISGLMLWRTLRTTARMQNQLSAGKSRKNAQKGEQPVDGGNADDATVADEEVAAESAGDRPPAALDAPPPDSKEPHEGDPADGSDEAEAAVPGVTVDQAAMRAESCDSGDPSDNAEASPLCPEGVKPLR